MNKSRFQAWIAVMLGNYKDTIFEKQYKVISTLHPVPAAQVRLATHDHEVGLAEVSA